MRLFCTIRAWSFGQVFLLLIISVLFTSCAGLQPIPVEPRSYSTDYDKVWNAAIDTLDELGYIPLQMQKDDGFITTERRVFSSAVYGIKKSATSFQEAFAKSASGSLPGIEVERIKITIRIAKQDGLAVVRVNPYIEHQSGTAPWKHMESNGHFEKMVQDRLAVKLAR